MKSTSILSTLAALSIVCFQLTAGAPINPNPLDQPNLDELAAPVKRDPGNSLESTPGPYHFKPAPVWPSKLESTPGPYKFQPAPVRRDPGNSLEGSPSPHHFQPASAGSLESSPGPYHFQPAPVT